MEEDGAVAPPSTRESNRLRVIQSLQLLGVTSRADVARHTGLSRSTVSTIVAGLQAEGVVMDGDTGHRGPSGGGRPPALISLDPGAGLAVGIDFGKRHLAVALADLSHRVLAEDRREMEDDYDAETGIECAAELVEGVLAEADTDRDRVVGVGMGLPGPVHASGVVGSSAILPGWAGTHAAERMSERLGMRVWLGNDANLGALSESFWGAGRGAGTVVYLKLATGIGAGVVIDGRLFEGAGGTAGEIGHTSLDETGDICRCGSRGCLETYASGTAIAGLLSRSLGEGLTLEDVLTRSVGGDPGLPPGARRRRTPHRGVRGRPVQPDQPRADCRRGQHGRRRRRAVRSAQRGSGTASDTECGRGRGDCPRRAGRARRVARRGRTRAPEGRSRVERDGAGGQEGNGSKLGGGKGWGSSDGSP